MTVFLLLFVFTVVALIRYFCLIRPYKSFPMRLLDLASMALLLFTALGASWVWALLGLAVILLDMIRKWDLVVQNFRHLT